jgi:hypothetical protein
MYISTVFLLQILGRQNVIGTTTCYLVDEKSSTPIENREEEVKEQFTEVRMLLTLFITLPDHDQATLISRYREVLRNCLKIKGTILI